MKVYYRYLLVMAMLMLSRAAAVWLAIKERYLAAQGARDSDNRIASYRMYVYLIQAALCPYPNNIILHQRDCSDRVMGNG